MPRKSSSLAIEELQDILLELPACKFSSNVKDKIRLKIESERARRRKAGDSGGRPKGARETIQEIDRTAYNASNEQENGLVVDESFDFG
jgi:hypothetical protein